MPFDATEFPDRRGKPDQPRMSDNEACTVIVILFVVLLLAPISMGALVDIVRLVRG